LPKGENDSAGYRFRFRKVRKKVQPYFAAVVLVSLLISTILSDFDRCSR